MEQVASFDCASACLLIMNTSYQSWVSLIECLKVYLVQSCE